MRRFETWIGRGIRAGRAELALLAVAFLTVAALAPLAIAQSTGSSGSTAKPQLVAVLIRNNRIEPSTIAVSAGRVVLVVHHVSARASITPRLSSPSGEVVKTLSLSGPNAKGTMDEVLSAGTYVLSEPGIPQATCQIVVQ
jgi:hypothetical protein